MTISDFTLRYATWLSVQNGLTKNEIQMLSQAAESLSKNLTKGFPFAFISYMLSKKIGILYKQPIASERKMQALLLGWQQQIVLSGLCNSMAGGSLGPAPA